MADDSVLKHRVVLLGAGGVGKSSILSQFLHSRFPDRYKETVEDFHAREYKIDGTIVKVDFLDTAGKLSFPAMRRLSITNATAFVLVYAIDDWQSMEEVKSILAQIEEQRTDYQQLPAIVVGNKTDLESQRQVDLDEFNSWLDDTGRTCSRPIAAMEASAKTNQNILDIFKKLARSAQVSPDIGGRTPALRRRLSAQNLEEKKFKEKSEPMKRSKSLMRKPSKPRSKHGYRANAVEECHIS